MPLSFEKPTIEWLVQVWECGRAFPRTYIEKTEDDACIKVTDFRRRLEQVPSITIVQPDPLTFICLDTLSVNMVGVVTAYPAHYFTLASEAFAAVTGSREGVRKGFTKR